MLSVKGVKRHIGKLRGVRRVANSLYWKILPNKIPLVVWGCISNFTFRPIHIHASIMPLQILNSKLYISCAILDRELSFEEKIGTQHPPPPPDRAPTKTTCYIVLNKPLQSFYLQCDAWILSFCTYLSNGNFSHLPMNKQQNASFLYYN